MVVGRAASEIIRRDYHSHVGIDDPELIDVVYLSNVARGCAVTTANAVWNGLTVARRQRERDRLRNPRNKDTNPRARGTRAFYPLTDWLGATARSCVRFRPKDRQSTLTVALG